MTDACRTGPRLAAVENVTVTDAIADRNLRGFRTIAAD